MLAIQEWIQTSWNHSHPCLSPAFWKSFSLLQQQLFQVLDQLPIWKL